MDARHYFLGRERLCYVIVDAYFEAEELIVLFAAGGKHYYGNIFELLYFLYRRKSVKAGHHYVH